MPLSYASPPLRAAGFFSSFLDPEDLLDGEEGARTTLAVEASFADADSGPAFWSALRGACPALQRAVFLASLLREEIQSLVAAEDAGRSRRAEQATACGAARAFPPALLFSSPRLFASTLFSSNSLFICRFSHTKGQREGANQGRHFLPHSLPSDSPRECTVGSQVAYSYQLPVSKRVFPLERHSTIRRECIWSRFSSFSDPAPGSMVGSSPTKPNLLAWWVAVGMFFLLPGSRGCGLALSRSRSWLSSSRPFAQR